MAFQHSFPLGSSSNPENYQLPKSSNPWMQVPPSVMPWTVANRPQLVRFGETWGTDTWGLSHSKFHKRKSDWDFNPKPAKIHITEEKMAAQLQNMHISNDVIGDLGDDSSECSLPTLVLSREVQNLPSFQEPLLPESLLPKVEKPTRALVLWKPPAGSLTAQLISNLRNESEEEVDNVNNNSSTPDLNKTPSASLVTEMEM